MLNYLIFLVAITAAALLLYPKVANNLLWRAAITPLASIIGSGFLVLGPILVASFGQYAALLMVTLCTVAYLFGAAIRFNIIRLASLSGVRTKLEDKLETIASWALAFAYIISVAYYLNLLGSFAVSMTSVNDAFHGQLVTSAVFAIILIVGWTRGFHALERMEQITVGIKLSIIAGLLFGLGWFFIDKAIASELVRGSATVTGWQAVVLAAGLLVTVQGFETSRYIGDEYQPLTRVRSMQFAQWTSTAIYMIYIVFLSYLFIPENLPISETAIIELMAVVAPILPVLLIIAAISAQFSAAVADTGGSGGLITELTKGRISPRAGYALLVTTGLVLTWAMSIFEIISYASRAFAFYYALQAFIAAKGRYAESGLSFKGAGFTCLGILGLAITLFGTSVE
ncbi:MAG: hypothetical protein ABJK37_01030 [Paraglaciecola sp.]|uniref:hypothetical protein n=1 Tax=Paraglaciecola sp. TaxID=1920173 RepID=UPI00329A7755